MKLAARSTSGLRPEGRGLGVSSPPKALTASRPGRASPQLAVDGAREREAESGSTLKPVAGEYVSLGSTPVAAVVRPARAPPRRRGRVEDRPGDGRLLGVAGVGVGQFVAAHEQARGLEGHAVAHLGEKMVVLHLERLHAQRHLEGRVGLGGRLLHQAHPAQRLWRGRLGDLVVAAPLADEVRPAVAADVQADVCSKPAPESFVHTER